MLKTPMKKAEKSMSMPIAFLVFFDTIYALLMLFLFPVWKSEIAVYISLMLGMITMVFWFKAQFSDPGFIRKPREVDFLVSEAKLI